MVCRTADRLDQPRLRGDSPRALETNSDAQPAIRDLGDGLHGDHLRTDLAGRILELTFHELVRFNHSCIRAFRSACFEHWRIGTTPKLANKNSALLCRMKSEFLFVSIEIVGHQKPAS